jgi:hypothetical protein
MKNSVLIFQPTGEKEILLSKKYFTLFNLALLGLFLAVVFISANPKPTRYTFFIYSIYALSAWGYVILAQAIRNTVEKWISSDSENRQTNRSRRFIPYVGVSFFLILISAFTVKRLAKNYDDLKTYIQVYRYEILGKLIEPVLEEARTKHASKDVYILHKFARHPAIGMLYRFKTIRDVRLSTRNEYNEWIRQDQKPKLSPNSVFYIWDRKAKRFNLLYGGEIE